MQPDLHKLPKFTYQFWLEKRISRMSTLWLYIRRTSYDDDLKKDFNNDISIKTYILFRNLKIRNKVCIIF